MSQRSEPENSLDDFPTPPWATRALFSYIIPDITKNMNCLEPACGAGHMSNVLIDYFGSVSSSDVHDYGYGEVKNFLSPRNNVEKYDWVITNPPFNLAEQFIIKSLEISNIGLATLVRTVFIESIGRYNRLFNKTPPNIMAQFSERVPMIKGRLDPKASTATGYCWLVWRKNEQIQPKLMWIPPCRRKLERASDYPAQPGSLL